MTDPRLQASPTTNAGRALLTRLDGDGTDESEHARRFVLFAYRQNRETITAIEREAKQQGAKQERERIRAAFIQGDAFYGTVYKATYTAAEVAAFLAEPSE